MRLHEGRAVADLALSDRYAPAVIDFHQHRDVRSLDEIENVFARQKKRAADQNKSDHTSPQSSAGRRSLSRSHMAESPAEGAADAHRYRIGKCDSRIQDDAQDDERKGLDDHRDGPAEAEIPHFALP